MLQTLARAGLASRAVIYVILAVLAALIVAHGRPPSQTSGSGALAEVVKQPAGPFLLGLLSAGLFCYGCWRVLQAIAGAEPSDGDRPSGVQRVAWFAVGALYFLLFAEALAIIEGSGGSGGPANHPQGAAATVLAWPGGPFLLGIGWPGPREPGINTSALTTAPVAAITNTTAPAAAHRLRRRFRAS